MGNIDIGPPAQQVFFQCVFDRESNGFELRKKAMQAKFYLSEMAFTDRARACCFSVALVQILQNNTANA